MCVCAFSSSGVCGSSVKTCRRENVVSWCVCVCEGEVTHGGHSSGQHQLSECEVQLQAKGHPAFGDKLDPPHTPTHTHTHRTRTRNIPQSRLPSSFKEFTPKQYALQTLLGLPLALGWASAPEVSVCTENHYTRNVATQIKSSFVAFQFKSNNFSALCLTPVIACNNRLPNKGHDHL